MNEHQPDTMPALERTPVVPVSRASVTIDDAFWSPRLQRLRGVTLDDVFDKFERDGALANFDRVAQGASGGHHGFPWFDGLIFETMRAAADFLATEHDARLDARLDAYIARIAAAQAADADGYLNTFVTLTCPEQRWGANGGDQQFNHEEYNAGCLVEAAVHHYRATGKTGLLALAVRLADYMCAYMGPAPRHNVVPSHSLPEYALLELYGLLRDEPGLASRLDIEGPIERYRELVRFWIDHRGRHHGRIGFTEYAQDHRPLLEQPEAVGHAVRATLLYTGLAALAEELDNVEYTQAAARLWRDVTERKLYITGGAGAIDQYEGFSYGYYLPSDGYNETCAAVGMAFWASRMQQRSGGAEFADIVERELYNAVLAGVSLAGTEYSYQNPLANRGKVHRWEWHSCPCCPPMLLKLYAGLGEHLFALSGGDIVVNQYIGSRVTVALDDGEVELELRSELPWSGAVSATLHLPHSRELGLRFRVPDWCDGVHIAVNGASAAVEVHAGYAVVRRSWSDGDTVELLLAMPIRRMVAHPFVHHLRERVALQRGPLIYCVEGVDVEGGEVTLPADAQLAWAFEPELLDGVGVIHGVAADARAWRAVPYFAWDNRPPSGAAQDWMAVWLRQAALERLRRPLDVDDRKGWQGRLYRSLPA